MDRSPATERSTLGDVRLYILHGIQVEICCEDSELCEAVGFVLAYFGFTPASVPDEAAPGGLPFRRAADVRLTFQHSGSPPLLPPNSAHILAHNGVEHRRSGSSLYLLEGRSFSEIHSAGGTAVSVIARSAWRSIDDVESSNATGPGRLRLGFVNLVLQTLLVLMMRHKLFPLHGAALANKEGEGAALPIGVLLVASGDSGKSTQAMGLVRAGWGFLSDDSLLLRPITSTDTGETVIEALPLRRDFGLDEEAARDFPEIVHHWQPFLTEERKRRVDMQAIYPGQALSRCAPRLLLFPAIAPARRSRIEPMATSETLLALVSHSPLLGATRDAASAHLDILRLLALQAPGFRLLAGRDLKHEPELLAEMIAPMLSRNALNDP